VSTRSASRTKLRAARAAAAEAGTASETKFDANCRRCGRLVDLLHELRAAYPAYHNSPVPPFGDARARLLIVGLAPGMHGANATGRPFTGDHAGILLYRSLYRRGFASAAESRAADDALYLTGCRITNAVKCLPPENKPLTCEVQACNSYLAAELASLPQPAVVLALGRIAHRAVLMALGLRQAAYPFAHAHEHLLPERGWLLDSYHCSRYNTQTGRLTTAMFEAVVERAAQLVNACHDHG
jgi:uracil-DNA glycosylase family 4